MFSSVTVSRVMEGRHGAMTDYVGWIKMVSPDRAGVAGERRTIDMNEANTV
jgi:hypothetical protein